MHDPVLFKTITQNTFLFTRKSNTNMNFRKCCLEPFLNHDQSASQSFQLTWKRTQKSAVRVRHDKGPGAFLRNRAPFTMLCLSQTDLHRHPLSLSRRKVFQLTLGVLKNPQPEKNRCIVQRVRPGVQRQLSRKV